MIMPEVRILIANDNRIVLLGLRSALEQQKGFHISGEALDGRELIEKAVKLNPDVIVSGQNMPTMTGIEAARVIKANDPARKIIIMTPQYNENDLQIAMESGIDALVLDNASPERLITMVEMVYSGIKCFFTPQDTVNLLQTKQKEETGSFSELTQRELEIYRLVARNFSNKEIAKKLFISEATVKTHISSILRKTNQLNRAQAVVYGLARGLFDMKELDRKWTG